MSDAEGGAAPARRVVMPSPAGLPAHAPAPPAPRPRALAGRRLLLLDNGQIRGAADRFGPLLDWLAADLERAIEGIEFVRLSEPLVTLTTDQLVELRARITGEEVAGVVLAVAHAGVTAPSTVLAGELERQRIPCVLICTALGRGLAETMAAYHAPGLPIVEAPALRGLSAEALAASRAATARATIAGLTTPSARPSAHARGGGSGDPAATSPELVVDLPGGATDGLDQRVWQELEALQMTDGLPVVAPTPERVAAMLGSVTRPPEAVLLAGPTPSGAAITVDKLAVNAVLAGCRPEYFPIVIAAIEAMAEPEYRFFQAAITTHPSGTAVIVSGPMAAALGIHAGQGCLGPGFRANATIGRAVNLACINIARAIPGRSNLATMGSPAQYSFCFAERDDSPWPRLYAERFDADSTTVTVLKCESPHNVLSSIGGTPEALLRSAASVAATLGTNAIRWPADHLVIINPAHAEMLADAGWTKADVASFLFEHARLPDDALGSRGDRSLGTAARTGPDRIPVVPDPSGFLIIVAGGLGPQMMVAPPWGLSRAVTKTVKP